MFNDEQIRRIHDAATETDKGLYSDFLEEVFGDDASISTNRWG